VNLRLVLLELGLCYSGALVYIISQTALYNEENKLRRKEGLKGEGL
jgi:hypothetical protein